MPVRITRTGGDFSQIPLTSAALMREVGDLGVRLIRTRTESGRDAEGQPFAPLSEGYQKARQKAGVGIGAASRLTLSGGMLNDMQTTRVTGSTATVAFVTQDQRPGRGGTMIQRSRRTGANAKASYAMGDGRVDRLFFALSPSDEDTITQAVDRYLDRVVQ